jgi:hypothetical protein
MRDLPGVELPNMKGVGVHTSSSQQQTVVIGGNWRELHSSCCSRL